MTSNVPATRGQYLTIDVMHARHDTAQLIFGRGADYVMTVRASMPALRPPHGQGGARTGPELKLDNFRTVQAMAALVLRLRGDSGTA